MKSGVCLKCGASTVYSGVNAPFKQGAYGTTTIPIAGSLFFVNRAALDNYVCTSCGYVESYVAHEHNLRVIEEN